MKMANDTICKQKGYIDFCKENGYMTNHATPQARKTAEVLWRYLTDDLTFEENHTAPEDVEIEAQIFAECVRQHKKMEKLAELDEGDV
jgi:ppGpp synthetase/RelA/SpoT-type nucleotidyltranferase